MNFTVCLTKQDATQNCRGNVDIVNAFFNVGAVGDGWSVVSGQLHTLAVLPSRN
jgi:hypothetical protein